MDVRKTPIEGLVVVESVPHRDARGAFSRLFCEDELASALGDRKIVQINYSRTNSKGAVRGMHFQYAPHAEMKFIRCLKGKVWDVGVDLRAGSPTFLQWFALELSPKHSQMLVVPEGCAHGFQVLDDGSELLYLHTAAYMPVAEGGVRYDDPAIGIEWPLPVQDISIRDQQHPLITKDFQGLKL